MMPKLKKSANVEILRKVQAHKPLRRFAREQDGATAIEYGLIAAGIAIALIAVIFSVGNTLNQFFTTVQTWLASSGT